MKNDIIYAVRDTSTGKLVNNITSPGRKYWVRLKDVANAIYHYNTRSVKPKHGTLEIVAFKLVEVNEE